MNNDDDGSEDGKVHYKITCRKKKKKKSPSKLLFKISKSHEETNYCSNHCPVTNENHYGITLIIMYKESRLFNYGADPPQIPPEGGRTTLPNGALVDGRE